PFAFALREREERARERLEAIALGEERAGDFVLAVVHRLDAFVELLFGFFGRGVREREARREKNEESEPLHGIPMTCVGFGLQIVVPVAHTILSPPIPGMWPSRASVLSPHVQTVPSAFLAM